MKYFAFALSLVASVLVACRGGDPLGSGILPAPSFRAAGPMPPLVRIERVQPSWMAPGARKIKKLLYVAGAVTNTVYVYDYKKKMLVGELTGFDQPNGECVDAKGDIWITNWQGTTVSEYPHGGSHPIATLYTQSFQTACSIDPTTGDLAVGSFYGTLDIWRRARGTPKTYSSSACPFFWGPGYDNHGNLFVEAGSSGSAVFVCWVPHRGKALTVIPFDHTINYGADVMWDGKYITFADQSFGGSELQAGVYRAKLKRSGRLKYVGETALPDPCGHSDVIQPFIVGRKNTPDNTRLGNAVTGSNNSCLKNVDLWAYPAGGDPRYVIIAPDKVTFGSVVSIKE